MKRMRLDVLRDGYHIDITSTYYQLQLVVVCQCDMKNGDESPGENETAQETVSRDAAQTAARRQSNLICRQPMH